MAIARIAPPNSRIFVFDATAKNIMIPACVSRELIASNDTCVSVGTLSESDGETTIEITSDRVYLVQADLRWTHGLRINTPGKQVSVVTSQNDRLLTVDCLATKSAITIGVNDESEPDRVVIFIS